LEKNIYLIADTHENEITIDLDQDKDIIVHLGDCGSKTEIHSHLKILIKGNHDTEETFKLFDFVCDSLMLSNVLFTHEPVERLPKGCFLNIHGHLHSDNYEDYGYKKKEFHIRLEQNKLYSLEEVLLKKE